MLDQRRRQRPSPPIPSAARDAADAVDLVLAAYDAAAAKVDGNSVRAELGGLTYGEARTIDFRSGVALSLRPVVGVDQVENPGNELLSTVNGEILTAPVVNVPSFADSIEIAGTFDEAEARSVAAAINGDDGTFSLGDIQFEFVSDE